MFINHKAGLVIRCTSLPIATEMRPVRNSQPIVHLTGVHLVGVSHRHVPMGGCLIGVHLMGVHLMGGCLMDVYLMSVHLMGRASHM